MKFKEGYKVRSMAGENVVIMQGTAGSDMTRIISLNDSSLLLWNELQGKEFEVETVRDLLLENYEIIEMARTGTLSLERGLNAVRG